MRPITADHETMLSEHISSYRPFFTELNVPNLFARRKSTAAQRRWNHQLLVAFEPLIAFAAFFTFIKALVFGALVASVESTFATRGPVSTYIEYAGSCSKFMAAGSCQGRYFVSYHRYIRLRAAVTAENGCTFTGIKVNFIVRPLYRSFKALDSDEFTES